MTGEAMRIVIIEDEESIRETMKWYFEDLGYQVVAAIAPNFCQGINTQECTASSRCADLLFIDQNLSGVTGLEYVRWLISRGCRLPADQVWIMTGALTAAVRAEAAGLGCNAVAKPFSLGDAEKLVLEVAQKGAPDRAG